MKKALIFTLVAVFFLLLGIWGVDKLAEKYTNHLQIEQPAVPIVMENPELKKTEGEKAAISKEAPKDEAPALKYINVVPFTSQAPYAKWDQRHQEACEEASIIMAHYYLMNKVEITMKEAEQEIQNMIKNQRTFFGTHKDLTVEEMIEFTQEYYEEKYQLVHLIEPEQSKPAESSKEESSDAELGEISETDSKNSSETSTSENSSTPISPSPETAKKTEDLNGESKQDKKTDKVVFHQKIRYLKEELAKGNIFIVPAAGRELGNPYFHEPGPLYHALVLVGYDESQKEFITNDPGTRRGEGYRYSYETIWDAIHDFPGKKSDILQGNKTVILIEKETD